MSPKNAIKMINIQNSYFVHTSFIRSILSSSVQFGPIQSIQSYLVRFVHWSFIQSSLVHSASFSLV